MDSGDWWRPDPSQSNLVSTSWFYLSISISILIHQPNQVHQTGQVTIKNIHFKLWIYINSLLENVCLHWALLEVCFIVKNVADWYKSASTW